MEENVCILKTTSKAFFTTGFNVSYDFYAETRDIAYTPSNKRTKNCKLILFLQLNRIARQHIQKSTIKATSAVKMTKMWNAKKTVQGHHVKIQLVCLFRYVMILNFYPKTLKKLKMGP